MASGGGGSFCVFSFSFSGSWGKDGDGRRDVGGGKAFRFLRLHQGWMRRSGEAPGGASKVGIIDAALGLRSGILPPRKFTKQFIIRDRFRSLQLYPTFLTSGAWRELSGFHHLNQSTAQRLFPRRLVSWAPRWRTWNAWHRCWRRSSTGGRRGGPPDHLDVLFRQEPDVAPHQTVGLKVWRILDDP